jgi:hypothetical protein
MARSTGFWFMKCCLTSYFVGADNEDTDDEEEEQYVE